MNTEDNNEVKQSSEALVHVQRRVRTYREDDWKAEVEVLEDNSDSQWERYKLKVIRTLRESRIYKPTPDGTIFDVERNKKYNGAYSGMWSLSES